MLKLKRRNIFLQGPWEVQHDVEERFTMQNAGVQNLLLLVCVCDVRTVIGCTGKMDFQCSAFMHWVVDLLLKN